MSTESEQARLIAERIARRVNANANVSSEPTKNGADVSSEIAAVRATLGELQKRLNQLEAKVQTGSPAASTSVPFTARASAPPTHSPWLAGVNAPVDHVSQERFGVEEATINELVDFFQNEKQCSIDPSGKPCDHCTMCSSRGF